MQKDGFRYIQLTDDEYVNGIAEASARQMGIEHGDRSMVPNDDSGLYIELLTDNRTPENVEAFEAALA